MSYSHSTHNNSHTTSGDISAEGRLMVIVITAGNCGACNELKDKGGLARITSALQSDGITVFNYEARAIGAKVKENDRFTAFINRKLMLWYPLFAVVPAAVVARYNTGSYNPSDSDMCQQIDVFNGSYKDGKFVQLDAYSSLGPTTVRRWISDYQRKKKSRTPPPTQSNYNRYQEVGDIEPMHPQSIAPSNSSRSSENFNQQIQRTPPQSRSNTTTAQNDNVTLGVPNYVRTFAGEGDSLTYVSCQNVGFTLLPRSK